MARAYVYMEESEYPPPSQPPPPPPLPTGLRPLPLPFGVFLLTFLWVASWSYEPNFWLNWRKILYPSPDWSSAFCNLSTNVLSVAYTVHIRFVRRTSVAHTAKYVSWPLFVRYLSVAYALLMRFTRSLHVSRRPSSPPRQLSSPDDHRINIFCIFSVRSASVTHIR